MRTIYARYLWDLYTYCHKNGGLISSFGGGAVNFDFDVDFRFCFCCRFYFFTPPSRNKSNLT